MINKKISVSEQVANLSHDAQLVFSWSIPHADDLGLLPSSARTLRAMIVPMWDVEISSFEVLIEQIVREGLWESFEYKGQKYYRIQKFLEHQTLKKDRKPVTYLIDIDSWDEVEDLGFQMEDDGNPSKEKIREDKRREVKISEDTSPKHQAQSFFENIEVQEEVVQNLLSVKEVNEQWLRKEVQKFVNYWTEPTPSGKKQKWETQKTFEIKRRLTTWLNNSSEWAKGRSSPNQSRLTTIL